MFVNVSISIYIYEILRNPAADRIILSFQLNSSLKIGANHTSNFLTFQYSQTCTKYIATDYFTYLLGKIMLNT